MKMMIAKFVAFGMLFYIVTCARDGEVMIVADDDEATTEDETEEESTVKFIPTNEWQTILPGQAIPRGLHVRINLETGLKEAKLMEGSTYAVDDLKDALSKIPDEGENLELKRPEKRFRPMEVLKDEFSKLNMNITTETEIIGSILENLFKNEVTEEEKIEAFKELEYYVHQYDNAQNFITMGGFLLVLPALNATSENLKLAAADLIGSAMQGNPKVQVAAFDNGLLQLLLHRLSIDSTKVKTKLLFALSTMIRHFPSAQKKFMDLGGMSLLTNFFQEDSEDVLKLQIKAINLIHDLIVEKENVILNVEHEDKEKLRQYLEVNASELMVKYGWCKIMPRLLITPEHHTREKVFDAMLVTIKSCKNDFIEVVPELKLLQQKYLQLSNKQTDEPDEAIYYNEIQQLISKILNGIKNEREEL
ncbi:nucleotide exchange factor sil1 [Chamberlinius hualienensis]